MCGLAGFARRPGAPDLSMAMVLFDELLLRTEVRGRHATGVAVVVDGQEPTIFKKAVTASMLLKTPAWQAMMNGCCDRTAVVMGHTRYATHNNAHEDEAAHPFKEGRVTGTHNGIISNWREVGKKLEIGEKWINDSQAPFGALNRLKDPVKALDLLDGYWALAWWKEEHLFFTKTSNAQLAVAYVPAMETMFWASERAVLEGVLKAAKLTYEVWELRPNTVYRYDPRKFDKDGTHGEKTDAPFRARGAASMSPRDTSHAPKPLGRKTVVDVTRDDWWGSTGRDVPPPRSKHQERMEKERKADEQYRQAMEKAAKRMTLDEITERFERLEAELASVREENAYLFELVRDSGLLDGDVSGPPSSLLDRVYGEDDEEEVTPYKDVAQGDLLLPREPMRCERCGRPFDHERPVQTTTGWIHGDCIFVVDV